MLYRLPPPISVAHAVLGQTVFCLILSVAQATSPWYLSVSRSAIASTHSIPVVWIALAMAAVYIQLILGAIIRHTGHNVLPHIVMALVTAGIVLWISMRTWIERPGEPALTRPASLLMTLVPLQLLLGLGAFISRFGSPSANGLGAAALRTCHVVCGAAILGTCAVLGLRAWRVS